MYECHLPCHMLMVITSFNNSLVTLRGRLDQTWNDMCTWWSVPSGFVRSILAYRVILTYTSRELAKLHFL